MGRICIDLFTTLDGVAQAPGGPEEDEENEFTFGGWQAPLIDEAVGEQVLSGMSGMDALLLGRKTYDIFAGYWPEQRGEIADLFNRIPKYVATRQNIPLPWADSVPLGSNIAAAVQDLRRQHERIHVIGSLNFVQTLLADQLFDQLTLWVHPILLGPGKRVFADGAVPTNLQLLEPAVTSPRGVVRLRYELVGGVPATGDMSAQ
ncbi:MULTISPECIES: dihydrofolate reductase family protein [unclassified Leucobacter]|uniref:dihydrofolate reductase family protein n=1 Tax=unclassified Leucobacter TaxID=2621730 RepID=UPI00165E6BC2|nr:MULTISPECIES: dihydrofolate reductase family protein [unclassified Leucobacter]MBC9928442.1 dihydrofolate reductase family protein [Leucobacter sp. cx-169]